MTAGTVPAFAPQACRSVAYLVEEVEALAASLAAETDARP